MADIDTKKQATQNRYKEEACRRFERDLVLSNPEQVGIDFDHDFIVDARNLWSVKRWLQYYQERDGQIIKKIQTAVDSGEASQVVEKNMKNERRKGKAFAEYLGGFDGKLRHVRVHPAGELSPISPSQVVSIRPDGSYEVGIASGFVDQVKMLQEQATDLTLVVQFYDHRRGKEKASNVPETSKQVDQYVAVCDKILESVGVGVQLEIGNETNISRNTGTMFADKLQHASHVNPLEYSRFFFEVAKLQAESGVPGHLIDTISFHPYREDPKGGSVEVRDGKFTANSMNYESQLDEMQKIASEFGVKLTVGEINFRYEDPEQKTKLKQVVSITSQKGVESLIYPGVHVH